MKKIWILAIKDLRTYFTSPIAYILLAAFGGIMGWMFFYNLSHFNMQNLQYEQMNYGKPVSITDGIVRPLYGNMNVIFLFLVPFITMRLFAEERKNQTLALLLTSPITLGQIVLGKFFSSFLFVCVMLTCTLVYPAILFFTGNPDLGPIVTCLVGTLLMASCYLSMGLIFSACTENQIVAGSLTFASGLFFWLISWAASSAGTFWGDFFTYLSLIHHFNNFSQGVFNTADIGYYLSFIGMSLFLTYKVLDSYRWR